MSNAVAISRQCRWIALALLLALGAAPSQAAGADRLVGIHAARVMSQSSPWIAQEAGLFARHGLAFELRFVASSTMVTAAMLSGEAEVGLGRQLRLDDRKVLEAAYASEIKALERRLAIRREGLEAVLEEVAQTDPRARSVKPEDLVDRRYLEEMETSGFFDKLWAR